MQFQLWRHILGLIAVATGIALAIMSILGSFDSFTDPGVQYGAAAIGSGADLGLLTMPFAYRNCERKGRKFALWLVIGFWGAFSVWTVASSATWLRHTFEVVQKPVEQRQLTEQQKQATLQSEQANLDKANEVALNGKSKDLRDNAIKLAADARKRIKELESVNTFQTAAAEAEPVRSPFSGYELLVTIGLLAVSQGLWFLAYAESEAESAAQKRPGKRQQLSSPRGEKAAKPKRQISAPSPAGKAAKVLPFRRKPSQSEVVEMLSSGKTQQAVADHFGYSVRTIRNIMRAYELQEQTGQRHIAEAFGVSARTIRRILEGAADGAHAAQMA